MYTFIMFVIECLLISIPDILLAGGGAFLFFNKGKGRNAGAVLLLFYLLSFLGNMMGSNPSLTGYIIGLIAGIIGAFWGSKYQKARLASNGTSQTDVVDALLNRLRGLASKTQNLSRRGRIIVIVLMVWCIYVIIRTAGRFELLGLDLHAWDEDAFLPNLFLPPLLIVALLWAFRWAKNGTKNNVQ